MRVGIDLVHIPSFKAKLENRDFLRRVFHPSECDDMRAEHLAGIFAAKEALFKARNDIKDWLDVEVVGDDAGPRFVGAAIADGSVSLSITHEQEYACAMVVCTMVVCSEERS